MTPLENRPCSLRGLRDTLVPMLLTAAGHCGIGFVMGAAFALRFAP